ncbi:GNAT family N-acetyltransferase [Weissella oryzae]|nr:GNAT family N-acetyltransferase [Weissella oryzae]
MQIKPLVASEQKYWQNVYIEAFPAYERIAFSELLTRQLEETTLKLSILWADGQNVGILVNVELEAKKTFILYLAIDPKIRSAGYGSRTLSLLKELYPGGVILESEQIGTSAENETQRVRRYNFYQKNGLLDTGYLTKNLGGIFHLLASEATVTLDDYLLASKSLGIDVVIGEK